MSRPKIVICAEYQGTGAAVGTITGFQLAVEHLIMEAGNDGMADLVVFCLGTQTRTYAHPRYPNVTFRQYLPLVSPRELCPYVSTKALPFRVELFPFRNDITRDIVAERPDVIHTFQTIGATDMAGLRAAKKLRRQGHKVRLISSVMTEIETYITNYFASYTRENLEFAETHSYLEELRAAWRMEGAEPPRGKLFRALNVLDHCFNHPICRIVSFLHRRFSKGSATQPQSASLAKTGTPFQRLLRFLAHRQISRYLKQADVVTTSRPGDAVNYQIPDDQVWHMPLSCNTDGFRPAEETVASVRTRLADELAGGRIDQVVSQGLSKFLNWIEADPNCFAIVTVGRLSDEKNLWLLAQAFQKLTEATPARRVYWLACGTGLWDAELIQQFPDQVALGGLVPNDLLPMLFNLARSRRFVYVSASDTETYGITHEESQRCGLPIVAMELGTRGHFYCQGDRIGPSRTVTPDTAIEDDVRAIGPESQSFICAANGLCVPDFSGGRGLNRVRHSLSGEASIQLAIQALSEALIVMERLPRETWDLMSDNAIAMTEQTKMNWRSVWQLLRFGVYALDRHRHAELIAAHSHRFSTLARSDSHYDSARRRRPTPAEAAVSASET